MRYDDSNDDDLDLTPAQRELESALRSLKPAGVSRVDRDRVLYEAGVAAGRRAAARWRWATAALVLGNAALIAIAVRPAFTPGPAPGTPDQIAILTTPPPQTQAAPDTRPLASEESWEPLDANRSAEMSASASYVSVREAVLRGGLSALPEMTARPARLSKPLDVDQLLGRPERTAPPPRPWPTLLLPFTSPSNSGEHL